MLPQTKLPSPTDFKNTNTNTKNTALIRQNIRKYGGYLSVPEPLPQALQFQIVDIKLFDPDKIIETNVDYNKYMKSDAFYDCSLTSDERDPNSSSEIVMMGRTEEGNSICVRVPFHPFLFLHIDGVDWNNSTHISSIKTFIAKWAGVNEDSL
jgi:hypothetical protein